MKNLVLTSLLMISVLMLSCKGTENKESEECEIKCCTVGTYQGSETIATIMSRKSVRSYLLDKPIEKDKIDILLKAGMAAPSGMDRRPWTLVVLTDRPIMDALADALPYAKMLKEAPMAMVVCGDENVSAYWYLDCSAVTQNILLAAEAMGLGAVWTAAYPYEDRMTPVQKYLELPTNIKPLCVIPIGYPDGEQSPKDKWDESKIIYK